MAKAAVHLPPVRAEIVELSTGNRISPQNFQVRVDVRARELKALGVATGDRVYLLASFRLDFLVDLFALMTLRVVVGIGDREQVNFEREAIERQIAPGFSIIDGHVRKNTVVSEPKLPPDTAFIIFTSGTSALPKAVVHTYENLAFRFESARSALGDAVMDTTISFLPLHFAHGLIGICLSSLFQSRRFLLPPDLSIASFSRASDWIDEYKVTFLSGTPATWNLLLRLSKPPQMGTLRRVQMASALATTQQFLDLRRWSGCDVWNAYGTSETASWVSDRLIDDNTAPDSVGDGSRWRARFEIVNPDSNGRGEVRIHTRSLFAGYLGADLKERDFFDSGDLGWLDEKGSLRLEGRLVRMINLGGLKVSPEEIELRLREQSGVEDAIVLATPSESGIGEIGTMMVLREGSLDSALPEILKGLKQTLSPHKIPTVWRVVEKIPRRSNGKPDLKEIGLLWQTLLKTPS